MTTTKSRTLSSITKRAILKYGYATCVQAYDQHMKGDGASMISHSFGILRGDIRRGDAAINAGRELHENNTPLI